MCVQEAKIERRGCHGPLEITVTAGIKHFLLYAITWIGGQEIAVPAEGSPWIVYFWLDLGVREEIQQKFDCLGITIGFKQ
jgi:hypothetical protein